MSPGRTPLVGRGVDGADLWQVAPAGWLEAVREGLAEGRRFAGLFALPGGLAGPPLSPAATPGNERSMAVASVLRGAGGDRVLVCDHGAAGSIPSLLPLVPAAAWDEREAHDVSGVVFAGHEPLRPLLSHDPDLAAWTVPVTGADVHQVAVGPIHAGVIESGHFRFHVVGERILHLDVRLFHKHRGLERAAEGRPPEEALAYAQRACGACSVANGVAFAHACEAAEGLWPTDDLRRARTVLLELERVYNHLHDISALCAGVGYGLGTMAFAGLKERAQRLNHELTGHRFLFGSVAVGSSGLSASGDQVGHARAALGSIGHEARDALRGLRFTASLQERLGDVGVVSRADAIALGAVGPGRPRLGRRRRLADEEPAAGLRRPGAGTGRGAHRRRRRAPGGPRDGAGDEPRASGRAARRADPSGSMRACRDDPARARARGRPRGMPARRDGLRRRARARSRAPDAPADGLLRQLAGARPRGARQPASGLPADQQELRALLRLRGPLMFVLLRQLRRARREIALPAPAQRGSLALRHVDAGSCNACEHELTATAGPHYDLQRFGLNLVASPRHADVLLVTGPVTTRMADALQTAYAAMPEPRLVAALGDCALGCSVLASREELAVGLEELLPVALRIPGCPPTPQQIADALVDLLARQAQGAVTP